MLVKVIAIDDQDRVKLSRKAALAERGEPDPYAAEPPRRRSSPGRRPRPRRPSPRRGPGYGPAAAAVIAGRAAIAAATVATEAPAPARSNLDRADVMGQAPPSPARACRPVPVRLRLRSPVEDPPRPSRDGPRRSGSRRDDPATPSRRTPPMADLSATATEAPDSQVGSSEVADDNLRLREQYAEIAQLAGGLAHEIRNPLSTMCLNLDLLAEDFQEPETPRERRILQKIDRIRRETQRLQSILEDFLRFARVQDLQLEPADLNAIVDDLRDFCEPQAATQGIVIRTALRPTTSPPSSSMSTCSSRPS